MKKLEVALDDATAMEGVQNTYIFEGDSVLYSRLMNYHSDKKDFTMRFYNKVEPPHWEINTKPIQKELERIDNLLGKKGLERMRKREEEVISPTIVYDNSKFEEYIAILDYWGNYGDNVIEVANKFNLDYENVPFGNWNSFSWKEYNYFEERIKHELQLDEFYGDLEEEIEQIPS